MKTIYYTAASLDGFIADADNSLDWLFQFNLAEPPDWAAFIEGIGAIAMGATTYGWLLDHELLPPGGNPKPWPCAQPAWVFSHRAWPAPAGADIRFVQGDVRPVHAAMASAAGTRNIWLVGGGDLVGQFWDTGLLDEVIVDVAPVTLGAGAPLLPRRIASPPLRFAGLREHAAGFVQLRYTVQRG